MKSVDPDHLSEPQPAHFAEGGLSVDIFGTITVTCQHTCTPIDLTDAARILLSCLCLHALDAPMRRDTLAEMLWPDTAPDASRHRLRTGLWRLRLALGKTHQKVLCHDQTHVWLRSGPGFLCAPHITLQETISRLCEMPLDDITQTDFDALTDALNSSSDRILENIDADWARTHRTRLADLYLRGLDRQLTWYRKSDRPGASIAAAQKLLQHDPYREDIHAMLIGLYAATGQPRKAFEQYNTCSGVLRDDLGLEASRAQHALHEALLQRGTPPDVRPIAEPKTLNANLTEVLSDLQHSVRALTAQVDALRAALTDR